MARSDAVAEAGDYKVTLKKAADLVPYIRNTRKHSDEQIAAIMGSLLEFGFARPVLENEKQGHIVAGHGTTMAALRLYEQGKTIKTPSGKALPVGYVPVLDCSGWSKAQVQAYIIADNAIAERADWDTELLKVEIGDLEAQKFPVDLLGFDPDTLGDLIYGGGLGVGGTSEEIPPDALDNQFAVTIKCRDAAHQEEVFNTLQAEGYDCKIVVV